MAFLLRRASRSLVGRVTGPAGFAATTGAFFFGGGAASDAAHCAAALGGERSQQLGAPHALAMMNRLSKLGLMDRRAPARSPVPVERVFSAHTHTSPHACSLP